jgi:hypothetical protein
LPFERAANLQENCQISSVLIINAILTKKARKNPFHWIFNPNLGGYGNQRMLFSGFLDQ